MLHGVAKQKKLKKIFFKRMWLWNDANILNSKFATYYLCDLGQIKSPRIVFLLLLLNLFAGSPPFLFSPEMLVFPRLLSKALFSLPWVILYSDGFS